MYEDNAGKTLIVAQTTKPNSTTDNNRPHTLFDCSSESLHTTKFPVKIRALYCLNASLQNSVMPHQAPSDGSFEIFIRKSENCCNCAKPRAESKKAATMRSFLAFLFVSRRAPRKPDYVLSVFDNKGDGHSSSTPLTRRLKPPTRNHLPGRNQAVAYLVLLPVEIARFTRTESARLCCSDPRLAAGRRYLLRCPAQSGLSSRDKYPKVKPPAIVCCALRERALYA